MYRISIPQKTIHKDDATLAKAWQRVTKWHKGGDKKIFVCIPYSCFPVFRVLFPLFPTRSFVWCPLSHFSHTCKRNHPLPWDDYPKTGDDCPRVKDGHPKVEDDLPNLMVSAKIRTFRVINFYDTKIQNFFGFVKCLGQLYQGLTSSFYGYTVFLFLSFSLKLFPPSHCLWKISRIFAIIQKNCLCK